MKIKIATTKIIKEPITAKIEKSPVPSFFRCAELIKAIKQNRKTNKVIFWTTEGIPETNRKTISKSVVRKTKPPKNLVNLSAIKILHSTLLY